jgi:hypothetical protein
LQEEIKKKEKGDKVLEVEELGMLIICSKKRRSN